MGVIINYCNFVKISMHVLMFFFIKTYGALFVFEQFKNDFGTLSSVKDMSQTIRGLNNSSELISIDSVTSSSPFADVSVSSTVLEPNEKLSFSLKFKYPATEDIIINNEYLTVYTSHGDFFCMFSTQLTPLYRVSPPKLSLNKMHIKDTTNTSVVIEDLSESNTTYSIQQKSPQIISAVFEKFDSSTVLNALIVSPDTLGEYLDTIVINTPNKKFPEIILPISGQVVKPINPNLSIMDFGKISSKMLHVRYVVLESRRTSNYKITKIVSRPSSIYTNISGPNDSNRSVISTIYPGSKPGPFKGVIELYIDSGSTPEIIIPVKGEIVQ